MLRENKESVKAYITALEIFLIIIAGFGAVWKSTLMFALSPQGFMMLYGAIGAIACEIVKRAIDWKFPDPGKERQTDPVEDPGKAAVAGDRREEEDSGG